MGAGIGRLGLRRRPTDLGHLQAVAAVGQSRLIEAYNRALEPHGRHAAQILLTADDLNDRTRYLNVRNTLLALFQYQAIPIINENDTVRVDELRTQRRRQRSARGDGHQPAAGPAAGAAFRRGGPLRRPSQPAGVASDPDRRKYRRCDSRLSRSRSPVDTGPNHLSKGGMASKLEAARLATSAGENVIIANGRRPNVLMDIAAGAQIGTLFLAQGPAVASRKRWIGLTAHPAGKLLLDAGAQNAVEKQGRSLLAVGDFGRRGRIPQRGRRRPLPPGWRRNRPRADQLRLRRPPPNRRSAKGPNCRDSGTTTLRRGDSPRQSCTYRLGTR